MEKETNSKHRGSHARTSLISAVKYIRDIIVIIVISLLLSMSIKTFLLQSFYIPSESMQTTLNVQDHIMVNKLQPKIFPLEHGDIIVFEDTELWMAEQPKQETDFLNWMAIAIGIAPDTSGQHIVKRVIGLAGDTVSYSTTEGKLNINGKLIDEPYLNGVAPSAEEFNSGVIPEGYIWVMGDNRPNSADSRYHRETNNGLLPLTSVVGKAFIKTFPLDQITFLDNYTANFN